MLRECKHVTTFVFFGLMLDGTAALRADDARALGTALDYTGFDLRGQRNPLSGGIDFLATNDFDAASFDFGAWDLSLQGPLSLQVSTGGRLLSQFDVSFSTAVNGATDPSPLSYVLNSDSGGQSTQIAGNLFLDADFSINQFGFYDLNLAYSSRQSVAADGRFSNETTTHDSDLGPIRVSGNIYADTLALLTDPLFDRAGQPNLFASFSGNELLTEYLTGAPSESLASLASSVEPAAAQRYPVMLHGLGNGRPTGPPGGVPPGQANGNGNGNGNGNAVPEPPVLLLMLMGLPALLSRTRRAR